MTSVPMAVGLVGSGAVGQAVGGALVTAGVGGRLLVASRTDEQSGALADDLADMQTAVGSPVRPIAAATGDLRDCEAVVIAVRASFVNTRGTDVRMGGARANAQLIGTLACELHGYTGTVLMVTNPVDLMARRFAEVSDCRRVFGIGSGLDTARYRLTLARLLGVPVAEVKGHVIGEHGEAAVVCASSTTVNDEPVPVPRRAIRAIRDELTQRPGRINAGIGRTRSGPAGAVVTALRLALAVEDGVTELSTGYGDDFLGIPLRFTRGEPVPSMPPLDPVEAGELEAARGKLRAAYQMVSGIPPQPLPSERNPS
ncbi:lactate dehydrogenase [Streptomyces sp. ISL-12]|uniref:lactate/malate family dehydrogenase n=1 Tax=Streptomyces sp. ISL-12 TaxID=2819177 RepID=UPI001BEBF22E|nr:lactate dehydrogenase [Streptomyces sp. ISL-12]MBT2411734.1 lactate dehydrogenase [Streptomyces sp. ISL-12]